MSEDYGEIPTTKFDDSDLGTEKKDNKLWIIIAVVVLVLGCCCLAVILAGVWLWNNGDALFGLSSLFNYLLL